jgi:hypothetical protein
MLPIFTLLANFGDYPKLVVRSKKPEPLRRPELSDSKKKEPTYFGFCFFNRRQKILEKQVRYGATRYVGCRSCGRKPSRSLEENRILELYDVRGVLFPLRRESQVG